VLWFRISRNTDDPEQLFGNINYGKALILINRGDYFQSGLIIRKGSFEEMKRHGLGAFRRSILQIAPYIGHRVEELKDWDQIKLLTVQINRLRQWSRPGLLCIGDAAHAMSPAGGIGINLAIQDAVATANLLAGALREGRLTDALVARVQKRREFPTRVTQAVQVNAHKGFEYIFHHPGRIHAPWQMKLAFRIPGIQRLIARFIGIGVRPEHIHDAKKTRRTAAAPSLRAAVFVGVFAGVTVRFFRGMRQA
jgi:2-polyprenyl-6-methoxyphenol hydroxylase-like FAD-dependent oxidoreductase